jgi:hypothetical protein
MANVWRVDDSGYPIGGVYPEGIPAVDAASVWGRLPARGAEDGRTPGVPKEGIRLDGPLAVEFESESRAGNGPFASGVADLSAQQNELAQGGIGRGLFEKFQDLNALARLGLDRLAAHHGSLGTSPAIAVTATGREDAEAGGSHGDACEELCHGVLRAATPRSTSQGVGARVQTDCKRTGRCPPRQDGTTVWIRDA